MRRIAVVFALLASACGPSYENADGGLVDVVESRPDLPPIAPATECVVITGRDPAEGADHVDTCSDVGYALHPPAAGSHYGQWADFATYDSPVPWGFLVHSLEHGAVILARSCDASACPEVVAAFEQIHASTGDPLCRDHANANRIITVFDPSIDVPIAAVAWGHVYRATCLDTASLSAFVTAHYAQAPENLCFAGNPSPTCP